MAINIKVNVATGEIEGLLERYSEWLDSEGLIVSVEDSSDDRGHGDLVSDFIEATDY